MGRPAEDEIAQSTDVDALWSALRTAIDAGDDDTAGLVRRRMAELSDRPFAHLSDDDLHARIAALRDRERDRPEPINVWSGWTEGDTSRPALEELNRHLEAARDTRHDDTLGALVAEARQRGDGRA